MAYPHYPKKKNTHFIKAVTIFCPRIQLDLGPKREKGYSIFLSEYPNKRWMMIDINDFTEGKQMPNLMVCIDVHKVDFSNESLASYFPFTCEQYPSDSVRSKYWMNKNNDAVHLHFYDDDYRNYDFESEEFSSFLKKVYLSFKKRQVSKN